MKSQSVLSHPSSALAWLAPLACFAFLWFILVKQLGIEWNVNPQYAYGWVVPVLCLGLFWQRWQEMKDEGRRMKDEVGSHEAGKVISNRWSVISGLAFAVSAVVILPTRLLLEATPGWRTLNWLLAGAVICLTLIAIYWSLGAERLWLFAFPVFFVLVAVPWPQSLEIPIIQGLTRANVATTIEILAWLGIPAAQQGNLIQISTGVVGVNEACSGIRSFQSSIMISLFLGELYRMRFGRRVFLFLAAIAMAFLFNICRTTLLVSVASKKGISAIENWHDPAGLTITVACVLGLWALAATIERLKAKGLRLKEEPSNQMPENRDPAPNADIQKPIPEVSPTFETRSPKLEMCFAIRHSPFAIRRSLALLAWLILSEAGIEIWYRAHESPKSATPEWTLDWPPKDPSFRETTVPDTVREMLKYDEGHSGSWHSDNDVAWMMYYFRWFPGRMAVSSARGHTPDVCLTASGKSLRPLGENRCPIALGRLVLPFRRYEYEENGRTVHVFHCLWEEHAAGQYFQNETSSSEIRNRLLAVAEGRRNRGQRSIEIAVWGLEEAKEAQAAVVSQLEKLVKVNELGTAAVSTAAMK